jgi:predicted RNase H-like nuclease (RuvC/YqgF family)
MPTQTIEQKLNKKIGDLQKEIAKFQHLYKKHISTIKKLELNVRQLKRENSRQKQEIAQLKAKLKG